MCPSGKGRSRRVRGVQVRTTDVLGLCRSHPTPLQGCGREGEPRSIKYVEPKLVDLWEWRVRPYPSFPIKEESGRRWQGVSGGMEVTLVLRRFLPLPVQFSPDPLHFPQDFGVLGVVLKELPQRLK